MNIKLLALFDYYQAEKSFQLYKSCQETDSPEQNLWGVTKLKKYDIFVEILPYRKYKFLPRDIEQQLRVFWYSLNQSDLIVYSTCQTTTIILAGLKNLGIFKKTLIVKLERPFKVNLLTKILVPLFVRGHDKVLCLSKKVETQLEQDFNVPKQKLALLDWGPDLPSYKLDNSITIERFNPFIISAGNSSRDFNLLVAAFQNIDFPLEIYCSEKSAPKISNLLPHIKIYFNHATATSALSWQELVLRYHQAYAVAIPLHIPESRTSNCPLWGLTSLLDAMAVGKASIMTKHQQVNIDIEHEGIGLWVEPGDMKGWEQAINYLIENPKETKEMGKRARLLAETKFNLEKFSFQLAEAIKDTINSFN
ncbi:MAG: glycosyltransferase [Xenococcaceae cyanobacterium MO_167.B52]|nr:glycosyltransferase [Xenococcaceae cyanobacterium MO_167.B52]